MREAFSHIFKHVIIYCAEWSTFSNLHTHAIMPPFITVLFYSSPFAAPTHTRDEGTLKKTVEFVVYHYLAFCSNSSCILPYISPGFEKPLSQKNLFMNTLNGGKGGLKRRSKQCFYLFVCQKFGHFGVWNCLSRQPNTCFQDTNWHVQSLSSCTFLVTTLVSIDYWICTLESSCSSGGSYCKPWFELFSH